MFVNSADDFINPPELGIAEREIKRVKNGKFVLIPIPDQTHGHGTHTYAAVWQQYLKELLETSQVCRLRSWNAAPPSAFIASSVPSRLGNAGQLSR